MRSVAMLGREAVMRLPAYAGTPNRWVFWRGTACGGVGRPPGPTSPEDQSTLYLADCRRATLVTRLFVPSLCVNNPRTPAQSAILATIGRKVQSAKSRN